MEVIEKVGIRNIAVIGLGLMGTPIASLLLKAGFQVRGFDIIQKQVSSLVRLGLKPASSEKLTPGDR